MATNGTSAAADQSNANLGKDEVSWFFVEQYYTTLSKTPEKLHLFYSKRSQFVYGKEAEVANVSVGRQEIQERIKSLNFKDNTKVRVSNVDCQMSHENIVIQVIGETALQATEDPKKFVQTFVLAKQPSGYFVLNDILRYIDDSEPEEEQLVEEPATAAPVASEAEDVAAPTAEEAAPEPVAAAEPVSDAAPPAAASLDAGVLDQKLEEVNAEEKETTPVNGDAATEQPAEAAAPPEAAEKTETAAKPDPEATSREVAEEDAKEPEKPKDPSPTPVASRQPPAPAAAPAPAQPPKPMTWASRIAAAAGPRPAVPAAVPKTATPPASRPAAQAPPAPAAQPAAPAPAPAPASEATPANAAKESTEWQTAGSDNKRHGRPQSVSAPRAEKEGTLGYVKFTAEKVDPEELRSALSAHGELVYFDVNRQKSCAFIEFATPAGYQAAVAANPHVVNGESIMVEPRRPKAGAYGGASYNTGRGGNMSGRGGRGGFDGGRSGSQGGRGNFGGQGRGRGGMPRGGARGGSQGANA